MADERLNDQPIAKDGAYVYAEDASGNQIKISKADLATVVAGVIRGSMLQTFVSVGSKEKLDAGITSSVNTVIGFATPYIQNITGYGDNHIVGFALMVDLSSERQIAFGIISKKWYVRSMSFSSGTWTAWEQI